MKFNILRVLSPIFLFSVLSCSSEPEHDSPMGFGISEEVAQKIISCDTAKQTFEDSLHPQLVTSCQKCHGVDHPPLFAVVDKELAFKRTLAWVKYENPLNSMIILNSSNNHCKDPDCRGDKPELNEAVNLFANQVNICRNQSDITPIDPEIAYEYFKTQVRPTLEHHCARCHGKSQNTKPIDRIVRQFFDAPRYLLGSTEVVYQQSKKYLALEKNNFYASALYATAAFPHFDNGDCENLPGLEQEEQSPCKQIIQWWNLEKDYLESIQGQN